MPEPRRCLCVYTFESRAAFDKFCEYLEILQETLDTIAEALIDENSVEEYCFEYENYLV